MMSFCLKMLIYALKKYWTDLANVILVFFGW